MEEVKVTKINELNVVGTLVEADIRDINYTAADGSPAVGVGVKAIVKFETEDGEEHLIRLENFTNKLKKDGNENKIYPRMKELDKLLNKKVSVVGSTDFNNGRLEGNRYWSAGKKEVVTSVRYGFLSMREAFKNEKDGVTFKFSGFVMSELTPKEDKDGNIEHYTITLGQATYNNDKLIAVPFIVDVDNAPAVKVIQANYGKFKTVEIGGTYRTKEVEREVTVDPQATAFGVAIPDALPPLTYRNLVITTGNKPFSGEEAYSEDFMRTLLSSYKKEAEDIKAAAEAAEASAAPTKAKAAKAEPSLDDLL